MRTTKLAASLLVMLALVLGAAPARAETEDCTAITALPAVISTQGLYCFTGNLATAITSGNAIDIQTNNVVLDLNGFKLGGLGAGPGTSAIGIHAIDRQNITIKNGTVRGFFKGILLETAGASQGHLVEDIRADQNTYVGIDVRGAGTIIRNNQVVATGGTTTFGLNADAFGILAFGQGPRVLNNDVINTAKQGTGTAWGIFLNSVTGGLAVNNRITGADRGIEFNGTGKYRDNLTIDVTTPYTGGTDAGNNDSVQTYTLSVSKTGTGSGTVTSSPAGINCGADCTENYSAGTVVTLTATASIGSTFSGWGDACSGTGTCVVTVDAAKSVSANYLTSAHLVINEVSPNIPGSRDLVELLVVSGGSLAGMKLEQDLSATVTLATFPALVVATGDLIVVHMMPTVGETTETNTPGECSAATCYPGAWDIAGAAAGITFTNHILVVRGPTAEIIDAVPFFVNGNTLAAFPGNLQALQAAGQWLPADCGGVLCTYASTPTATGVSVDWTGSTSTNSVQRKPTADTNTQADWNTIGTPTFGAVNL